MNQTTVNDETINQNTLKAKKAGKVPTFFFGLWVIIAVLLIQVAISVIGIIPVSAKLMLESGGNNEVYMEKYAEYLANSDILTILQFVAEIVCIIVLSIWYYFGYVKKDKKNGVYKPVSSKYRLIKDSGFILCGSLACFGLAATLSALMAYLMPSVSSAVSDALNLAMGGNTVILAPVCEELALRGIVLQRSKRAYGFIGCIIISAVLFGIFHLNPIQGIYVLPMGLFWGFIGYRFNSVIPCLLCHFLNNLYSFIMPQFVNPILLFIVFGVITALIGVKWNCFALEKEEHLYVEEK